MALLSLRMFPLLSASFGEEIRILFSEMGVAAAVCLCIGLLFLVLEIFVPGFGFFGVSGTILVIAGMVLRVTSRGNGSPLFQILLMIMLLFLVCAVAFAVMAFSAKKGWLSRTPFVMRERSVSTGKAEGTADYSSLIGKEGRAVSMLRPSGIAEIDGERLDVVAEGEFISPDSPVAVAAVEGVRIVVREIKTGSGSGGQS